MLKKRGTQNGCVEIVAAKFMRKSTLRVTFAWQVEFCSRFWPMSWTAVQGRSRFPIYQQVLWWTFAENFAVAGTDVTSQIMLGVRPKDGRGCRVDIV